MIRRKWSLCWLGILLLIGCRPTPPPTATPVVPPPPATWTPTSRPTGPATAVPTDNQTGSGIDLFFPLVTDNNPTPTPTPLPPTPAPPTATPRPAYPVYTGPPLDRSRLGVQVHIRRENLSEIFTHLNQLGVGWVKVQVSWKLYEPFADDHHEERFVELDRLVEIAEHDGIAVLLSVSKAPEWSRTTTEMDGPPANFDQFRQFMAELADRYRGRVAAYELWNEPNLQREWNGRPLSPADFVRLISQGAEGVRSADPDAILISGAPATTGIDDGVTAIDDRQFLRGMLAAGAGGVVDAIGVHPYGWANPADGRAADPSQPAPSHNNHPSFFFLDTLADYRTILNEFGLSQPLWPTEFGWGSFDGLGGQPPAGAEFMTAVTEWQQAEYILRAFELSQLDSGIGPMFLWNLNFGPLLGNEFSESGYSLLRPDKSQRPAYLALAAAQKK